MTLTKRLEELERRVEEQDAWRHYERIVLVRFRRKTSNGRRVFVDMGGIAISAQSAAVDRMARLGFHE